MSATTYCLNGSLLTLIIHNVCCTITGKQCRINNSESESELNSDGHFDFMLIISRRMLITHMAVGSPYLKTYV